MDILQACEDLANNIASFNPFECSDAEIPKEQIQRWQHLFGFAEEEAIKELGSWRADLGRTSIPFLAWQEISQEKKRLGYDKQAYEYSLSSRWLYRQAKAQSPTSSSSSSKTQAESIYLVKLEGSITSAAALQRLAELPALPEIKTDQGDTTESFAVINGKDKEKILANLPTGSSTTIISISRARKDLSHDSAYPTLGLDTTLPQNRSSPPIADHQKPQPGNEDYPVWYFFYGTLADGDRVGRLLGPDHSVSLIPAWTVGGRLGTWAGKYKALVDDFGGGSVHGHGFLVQDKEAEDALRYYETGAYEVVRCEIHLVTHGGVNMVKGLTFRFTGGNLEE
ncbi:unnamed protein product [Clonostachys rhizophaga]|uniref:Putative gamma-glutamylcyclotransferase n=1 Tax=Clonostachys rhizophaga TaxID=160324 RepID=A0A9N9VLK7_9HYPO|nr:unnamed protein product [Clonostachys rhizophaga]